MHTGFSKTVRLLGFGLVALALAAAITPAPLVAPIWAGAPGPQGLPIETEPISFRLEAPVGDGSPGLSAALVHPASGGDWSTLVDSGFEDDFATEGWQVQGAGWVQSTARASAGTHSAAVEDFDGAPATALIYGGQDGFSLQSWADARLDFQAWLDTDQGAYLGWTASADGQNFSGARAAGRVGAWLPLSYDLDHLIGDDSVWIAFIISGEGSGTGQNVFVDEMRVTAQEPYLNFVPVLFRNYTPPFTSYADDFDDPGSGWPVEHVVASDHEWHREYTDGTYHMQVEKIWFHRIFALAPGVTTGDNYVVQVDMKYDFEDYRADWGLVFGATGEPGNCYMVTAHRYGEDIYYDIRIRYAGGKEQDLDNDLGVPPYALQENPNKWNRLRVTRQGSMIHFEAYNFTLHQWFDIDTVYDTTLSRGGVGLTVFSSELGSEAYFDNFQVWSLDP
jgi:hypothetical protein